MGQFTYIPDTSRRGDKIAIALLEDYEEGLVSNVYTEIAAFEKTRKLAVINNTQEEQVTDLYIDGKVVDTLTLKPMEMRWVNY